MGDQAGFKRILQQIRCENKVIYIYIYISDIFRHISKPYPFVGCLCNVYVFVCFLTCFFFLIQDVCIDLVF